MTNNFGALEAKNTHHFENWNTSAENRPVQQLLGFEDGGKIFEQEKLSLFDRRVVINDYLLCLAK